MATKNTKPAAAATNDVASMLAALQAQITALTAQATPAKPVKKVVAAKAVSAEMVLDFSCLRQTGRTRSSSTGKTLLVPVMGKLADGTTIGGTLWVK